MNSDTLQRNFEFKVDIDSCNMVLRLTIEKLEYDILLFDFDWG